jgi:hypothetical protein
MGLCLITCRPIIETLSCGVIRSHLTFPALNICSTFARQYIVLTPGGGGGGVGGAGQRAGHAVCKLWCLCSLKVQFVLLFF